MTNSVYILSMDAKDLVLNACSLRDREGALRLKKFTNTLDASMELDKLREAYEKVCRRRDFSFCSNGKEYSQWVVNVTFQYSIKEFNRFYGGIYIKYGRRLEEADFQDSLWMEKGELLGIQTGVPVNSPASRDCLGGCFYEEGGVYLARDTIKTRMGVAELRKKLYTEGFDCDGIHYVRYKRSAGSSRVGKCLFIDERLYPRMHKWELCGIQAKPGDELDLAALEAYIALPLSSSIGSIAIRPENILVIQDRENSFDDQVAAVDEADGCLRAREAKVRVTNNIWDGQSLIDTSLMGPYSMHGFILVRGRMFKSACFNCNLQQWFRDRGITQIAQLNGFTLAKNIEDVKLVTTPSSIKYLKFGRLENWLKRLEPSLAVVKHESPTHFFDGRLVQLHYQLLNTLQLSKDEMEQLLAPSLNYLRLVKTDPKALRFHIKFDGSEMDGPCRSKNDVIYKMLGVAPDFSETKLYHDFKNDLSKAFLRNLRLGHVLVNGNYSTLLGNPVEMLLESIGGFDGLSQMGAGNVHSKRFPFGVELLGSRSPHVTMGNILVTKNMENPEIDRYFNLTDGIVCVNSIQENLLNRLSGSDYDSDTLLLTDQPILLAAAKRNYSRFKVPTGLVSAIKVRRKYTSEELADLDVKTSVNKIGEIVNLSQQLNSLLWDRLAKGEPFSQVKALYLDIAKLDVLSNLEIDRAKKEFPIDSGVELAKLKAAYRLSGEDGRKIEPGFFGVLAKAKGYHDPLRKDYRFHQTAMDYLQQCVNAFRTPSHRGAFLPFSALLKPEDYQSKKVHYAQIHRIIEETRKVSVQIKALWRDETEGLDGQQKYLLAQELREACTEWVGGLRLEPNTMYRLLATIESEECRDISRMLFTMLFSAPNQDFFALIRQSERPIDLLEEATDGDYILYDFHYQKISTVA